jgi:hypothetical protein
MSDEQTEPEHLSVKDMQWWLAQEMRDLDKLRDLRVREATAIVDAYARGELTPAEASKRLTSYEDRWGDALPGTHASPNIADEAILAKIDAANAAENAWAKRHERRMALERSRPSRLPPV